MQHSNLLNIYTLLFTHTISVPDQVKPEQFGS